VVSQENVEMVRAAFQAFETNDMEGVLRLCDENIQITLPAELPSVTPHQQGHAGILEAFATWPEQWDDFRVDILRIAEIGDHVAVTVLNRGRGKDSGAEVEARFTHVFAVRGGKLAEWRIFMNEEEALKAVGLEE
jgi:ketosteroid isomerase-like protein